MHLAVTALLMLILLPSTVWAGVLISPARVEALVASDGTIPSVVVSNKGPEVVVVNLSLVGGGHDLNGVPTFDESNSTRNWLDQVFSVSPRQCILEPGETTTVSISTRVNFVGLYPTLMADITPLGTPYGNLVALTRIAVPMLLTNIEQLTTKDIPIVATDDIQITQSQAGGPLLVAAFVHNVGTKHVRTGGSLVISGPGVTETVYLKPVTILPGFSRRLETAWAPNRLPVGEYHVQLITDTPAKTVLADSRLQVVKPYELARVELQLEHVKVLESNPGTLDIQTVMANRGNVDVEASLDLALVDPNGTVAVRQSVAREVASGTGQMINSHINVRDLPPGEYTLQAALKHQNATLDTWEQIWQAPSLHIAAR